jgi:hypothetical protein
MLAPDAGRDLRIDWLRGLALASIFVNHMPGNRFENWTTRNFGFSDAAEVFVLLAGVAAAFAFFNRFERGQQAAMSLKAARRSVTLYLAHVGSTVAAIALFLAAAVATSEHGYLELISVAPLIENPWIGLVGVVTGGSQLGFFNILPLYVMLLLALPGFLWLAVRDLRLLIAVSLAVYLAAQVLGLRMVGYPDEFAWFFNPFAWQLLFVSGLALGIMRLRGLSVPYHWAAYGLAVGYLVFSAVWMVASLGGHLTAGWVPGWIDTLHKSNLPPPRLLHVLALAYVLVHSRVWQHLTPVAKADPLFTRLGRHSLPVFVAGSLLSMVGYISLVYIGRSILWVDVLVTVLGLAGMWLVALAAEGRFAPLLAPLARRFGWMTSAPPATTRIELDDPRTSPTARRG